MRGDLTARTTQIASGDGTLIEAYVASPDGGQSRGGVVVIHHLPGYDGPTKEITRRFADLGYEAVCPNLYFRQAPGADPDDAAASVRASGGKPDDELVTDVQGAAAYLRGLPHSNGKVGVIGYCSGGRQSVLAACRLDLDAAVDCYGAYVTGQPRPDFPIAITPLYDDLPRLSCPVLGLYGADDKTPSPEHVAELTTLLAELGKDFQPTSYAGAGHAFIAVNRASYRPEAAMDGWARIEAFYAAHLH